MPLVHIVSVVVSVSVTVPDGGVHHTVYFVFIFVSGVCPYTLLWYSIPNYMLLSFYIISTYHMYFYTFIYFSHIHEFFSYIHMDYFAIHTLFARFFSKFYLPDVVSVVFELFSIVSHVMSIFVADNELFAVISLVSIFVLLVDGDESNNVKFVLINMCNKWCETLYPYYIT